MNQEQMFTRLKTHFPDAKVEVIDLTGTEDHWEVHIASHQFNGLPRIQQHKLVMQAFDPELKTGEVHALTMKTKEI